MILDYPDEPGNDILGKVDYMVNVTLLIEYKIISSTNWEKKPIYSPQQRHMKKHPFYTFCLISMP